MSCERSSPPLIGSGWSHTSPSLASTGSGASTPHTGIFSPTSSSGAATLGPPSGISWASAKAKSDEVRGYPSFSTRNSGFFSRQKHKISARLPRFRVNAPYSPTEYYSGEGGGKYIGDGEEGYGYGFVDDEFLPGGKYGYGYGRGALSSLTWRRRRFRILLGLLVLWIGYLLFWTCEFASSSSSSFFFFIFLFFFCALY